MNALDLQGQRRSWRQQSKPGGSSKVSRTVMAIIATALLVIFLCIIFWPQPDRQLKAFLIQASNARSYDTHVIMPPMYGVTVTSKIKSRFQQRPDGDANSSEDEITETSERPLSLQPIIELTGTAQNIKSQIDKNIQPTLEDKDDTVMVIMRGYLFAGESGPAIACSDFGADNASGSAKGLLPLDDVFAKLCEDVPKLATRLVVLDIEPLAGLPRFGQYDDEVFRKLEESVSKYSDQLWVLVTRGPFQNAGWDPKSKMPISTQILLDGLDGGANRLEDNDYQIDLRELVTYMADRYQQLGPDAPQPLLLRGAQGRIGSSTAVDTIRIVRAPPIDESKPDPEPDPVESVPNEAGEDNQTGRSMHRDRQVNVTQVLFQTDEVKQANADEPQAGESGDDAKPDDDDVSPPESTSESNRDDNQQTPTEDNVIAGESGSESFWDIRDRLESVADNDQLHPIAIAPDLWKRLIQFVLHAEIESMDPEANESRQEDLTQAYQELRQLESTIRNGDTTKDSLGQPEIIKLEKMWEQAAQTRNRSRSDSVVSMADQLQHAIVAVDMKRWSWQKYQLQAIAIGEAISKPSLETADARKVLADEQATEERLRREKNTLENMKVASDKKVEERIEQLLKAFDESKILGNSAWHEVRRAYAWLRSPLPSGPQRRALLQAVQQANVQTASKKRPDDITKEFELADTKPKGVDPILDKIRKQFEDDQTVGENVSRNNDGSFTTRFAAALRRDPIDTSLDDDSVPGSNRSRPIVHGFVPAEHIPQPTVTVRDKNNQVVDGKINLPVRRGYYLTVELKPDSDTETKVRVRHDLRSSMASVSWNQSGRSVNGNETELTIGPREAGSIRLDIEARHANQETREVPITISVVPIGPIDPHVAKLETKKELQLGLPQPDQIRVKVINPLLSNDEQFVSGNSDVPDGVWLRTFVSRKTQFSLSAYNNSGRACRAQLWLIKLRHPFAGEKPKISEYFAEVFESPERTANLRRMLVDDEGRVEKRILDPNGDLLLKGPKQFEFGPKETPTNISWKLETPAKGEETSEPAAVETREPADGSIDVSHGIALVIRLIDENNNPFGDPDQIVWLIPSPWSPDKYVDISSADYGAGIVRLSPEVQRLIDGDQSPDQFPEIDQQALHVVWRQDDQWQDFRPGTSSEPVVQASPRIVVPLANQGGFPIMRLGVDGWPRALRRRIDPGNGEFKEDIRWCSVRFASVAIDYGDSSPGGEDDRKLEPSATVYNPQAPVFFRAGGKSLTMRLHADVAPGYRGDTKVRVTEAGLVTETHRSDRRFATTLSEINDTAGKSLIVLETTVDDLSFESGIQGLKDIALVFGAEVEAVDGQGNRAEDNTTLQVHLDSEPPTASIRVRPSSGPYRVGDTVKWIVDYSDPGDVSSGVKWIQFGPANEDEKPGGKAKQAISPKRFEQSMELKNKTGIKMAVQVWDGVGLASEPASYSISVQEKKKPQQAMANNGKPGAAAAKPIKRGKIEGRITIDSTMNGALKLSPVPDGIIPADGVLPIFDRKPRFKYSNVPEGEYTLTFDGIVGSKKPKPLVWSGLKIDKPRNLKRSDAN